jgi:uracil-DNA glycosylase
MVVPSNVIPVNYKLDVNFSLLLHKSWLQHLNPILNSQYMRNMMVFLNEIYKVKYVTPKKADIFKPFELTDFDKIKVVILTDEPYHNANANGLAFGNPNASMNLDKDAKVLRSCIEETIYDGFRVDHDYSLESWAKSGVLLLNSALTYVDSTEIDIYSLWRNFTRQVIKTVDEHHTGICFLLLGRRASYYEKFIDHKLHHVFKHETPYDAYSENRIWDCPYFDIINDKIEAANGGAECIDW